MSAVGITLQDVSFAYADGPRILDQLNLEVEAGEILALLGPSGCGKSTLLRAIGGLVQPSAGMIHQADQNATTNLSFVFQDATLLPWRTVWQNVRLPFELGKRSHQRADQQSFESVKQTLPVQQATRGESDEELERRTLEILDSVGLRPEDFGKYPRELSGGMRMRTSIARALVTDPNVMLLDEPFAALDDLLRNRLNDLLLDLWGLRKRTILFVTHNIAEAVYLSHRIVLMNDGQVGRIISNGLSWPRQANLRTSMEFASLYAEISASMAEFEAEAA